MKELIITCPPLRFYSEHDEAAFFEWLKKITCIKDIKGISTELHLYLYSSTISDEELRDFFALFKRYNFESSMQLELFKNEYNAYWFED